MGVNGGGEVFQAVGGSSKGLEVGENILHWNTVGWSPE